MPIPEKKIHRSVGIEVRLKGTLVPTECMNGAICVYFVYARRRMIVRASTGCVVWDAPD